MRAFLLAVLLLMGGQAPPSTAALEARVTAYWNLLLQQDKASALEFVARDSRNFFIKRREPDIRSWKLVEILPGVDGSTSVRVELERAFPGMQGYFRAGMVETWVVEDSMWRVRVRKEDAESVLQSYRKPAGTEPKPEAGVLEILPEVLRIRFLDQRRRGGVRVANGLEDSLQVLGVEFDRQIFELVEGPEQIPPGEYGLFILRYTGDSIEKDQAGSMTIGVRDGESERVFKVPVIYNYLSAADRALFGLTPEEAEKLKPGDKLIPRLKPSPPVPKPPQ